MFFSGFGGVHLLYYYFESTEHSLWWDCENALPQGNQSKDDFEFVKN